MLNNKIDIFFNENDITNMIKIIPFHCFVSGDLAFYSMLLGMEHHERYWCVYCLSSKKEWEEDINNVLNIRTIDYCQEISSKYIKGHKLRLIQTKKA